MNTREAALLLGISPFYLRNLRHGMHPYPGPKCEKVYLSIGMWYWDYKEEDLKSWKEEHIWRKRELKRNQLS